MAHRRNGVRTQVDPQFGVGRRGPWSLLQAQWLDVPIGKDADFASLTWGAFSESFHVCLDGVSDHVSQRVADRPFLESIVTEVLVDNLDVLASRLENRDKLRWLITAADLLLARGLLSGPGRH